MQRLSECDGRLQTIFIKVLSLMDHTIVTGRRGEEEQNKAIRDGKSKLAYPYSNHNSNPSKAVDAAPWPIDWKDRERFFYFAGLVMGVAKRYGHEIRWGGDWQQTTRFKENNFDDLLHFEIVDK